MEEKVNYALVGLFVLVLGAALLVACCGSAAASPMARPMTTITRHTNNL